MEGNGGDERERLRREREEREATEAKSGRRRLLAVYALGGLVVIAAIVAVVVIASSSSGDGGGGESHINQASGSSNGIEPDERAGTAPPAAKVTRLKRAAQLAGCKLELRLKDEGHAHIPPTAPTPDYGTDPPTSGNHVEPPYQQADGAYLEMPGEIFIVHSLEHGRLQIQYSPELPEADQLELKGLYETMYGGALLFPNEEMEYEVAATTWTNLLGCPRWKGAATLDAIRAFGKATWGRYGGEPVNAFSIVGPTPAKPSA
jgi:Protein of unknown function (DUF3105)